MSMTDPRLIQAVQELDPGTRALLDLSLRRAIPDERVAGLLGVDLAEIPRRLTARQPVLSGQCSSFGGPKDARETAAICPRRQAIR